MSDDPGESDVSDPNDEATEDDAPDAGDGAAENDEADAGGEATADDGTEEKDDGTEEKDDGTEENRDREYDPDADHDFPDERVNSVLEYLDGDPEVRAYLEAQNVNPVARMGYNDHGPDHVAIVRNRALSLYELLKRGGVDFDADQQGLEEADEPVVVALAATLHDVGYVVHRHDHVYYSIPLAADVMDRVLPEFYDTGDAVRVKAEVLHAILCHHVEEEPLTTEAGVIRVADALDMERGRSRLPYERGRRGINTISSRAITSVTLAEGDDRPVSIEIEMANAAGVYQVDELLKAKLAGSGIEDHVRIVAVNRREEGGERLVERMEL